MCDSAKWNGAAERRDIEQRVEKEMAIPSHPYVGSHLLSLHMVRLSVSKLPRAQRKGGCGVGWRG